MNDILTNLLTALPLPVRKGRMDLAVVLAVAGLVLWMLLL